MSSSKNALDRAAREFLYEPPAASALEPLDDAIDRFCSTHREYADLERRELLQDVVLELMERDPARFDAMVSNGQIRRDVFAGTPKRTEGDTEPRPTHVDQGARRVSQDAIGAALDLQDRDPTAFDEMVAKGQIPRDIFGR